MPSSFEMSCIYFSKFALEIFSNSLLLSSFGGETALSRQSPSALQYVLRRKFLAENHAFHNIYLKIAPRQHLQYKAPL